MRVNTDPIAIHEAVTRGVEAGNVLPSAEAFEARMGEGRPLTAYLGIDPTGPELHVGHLSQLQRLRRLHDLGHNVTLLIGDFTGMIGDPTDKSAARQQLTREQVLANAAGYKEQAGLILPFDDPENPVDLKYNSDWLGKMSFADVLELASRFTVARVLERRDFSTRLDNGQSVGMHEILYPLMQGWDSVEIVPGGIDVEVGGSDQIFNMLVGRDLVKAVHGKEKFVIGGKLLEDPSGKKIGKTEGNAVTLTDPALDTFAHVMQWGDGITPLALELCTRVPMGRVREIKAALESGELPGLDGKRILAKQMVTEINGDDAAEAAARGFDQISSKDVAQIDPAILRQASTQPGTGIVDVLVDAGLAPTRSKARRLIKSNAVRVNGQTVDTERWAATASGTPAILHVGKYAPQNFRALTVATERPTATRHHRT